jgi:hypothetical protein
MAAAAVAEADDGERPDERELCLEPRIAGAHLGPVGPLVEPSPAARPPLEGLDHVGDEDLLAVDAGVAERPVEELPGRADERLPHDVLAIARLLAEEHDGRRREAAAEDGLGRPLPKLAGAAAIGQGADPLERSAFRRHGTAHEREARRV